jgi:hypothetical protein
MEIIDKRTKAAETRLRNLQPDQTFFKDDHFYIKGHENTHTVDLTDFINGSHQHWNKDCLVIPVNAHVEIID